MGESGFVRVNDYDADEEERNNRNYAFGFVGVNDYDDESKKEGRKNRTSISAWEE